MFSGFELYRIWNAGRGNGLTQRKLAAYLGEGFNSVHGRIWRTQKLLKQEKRTLDYRTFDRVMLKSAVFDIETTSLEASGIDGHLVCVSILPLDADEIETITISFEDERDDKRALQEAVKKLEQYQILIGHNIAAFDLGWLFSRLAYHGLPLPETRWLYYDTYQAAKRLAIKADRKSLAFLCDFFQVPFVKTAVYPVSWSKIDSPVEEEFRETLESVVFHCEEDVKANRKLFDALWSIDRSLVSLPVFKK